MRETIRTQTYTIDPRAYFGTFWLRWYWIRVPVLVAVYAAFAAFVASTSSASSGYATFGGCLGFTAAMVAFRYGYLQRLFRSPRLQLIMSDPRTMEFSDEALHTRTAGGIDSRVPWRYLSHAQRRGAFTLVFLGPANFFVIPDAAFASGADQEAAWALLREKGLVKKR